MRARIVRMIAGLVNASKNFKLKLAAFAKKLPGARAVDASKKSGW
jgi:hypothetical protein